MADTQTFTKGLVRENPVLILGLGLCPVLAVTTSAFNGFGMGVASTFVLLCSNSIVSLIRKQVPPQIRIPVFIVIIATFVTIVDMVMNGFLPELAKALGLFIPLIVVNCMILGRAEAFASKNTLFSSMLDGLGMGLGFTLFLTVMGAIREIIGSNKLLGLEVIPGYQPMSMLVLAPGGFLVLGFMIAAYNAWTLRKRSKA